MDTLTCAVVALNQTALDWEGNRRRIEAALTQARANGAHVICCPELCISGYGCEDAFLGLGTCDQALDQLTKLLPATSNLVALVGLPLLWHNALYNVVAVCINGQIAGFIAKQHLAGDGLHYEPRWFKPWPHGEHATYTLADQSIPLGDIYFDIGGVRIGCEICEDAWVAQRPGAELAKQAIDIIANPSASHFAFGKADTRRQIVCEGSRLSGATYLYANLLGNETGRVIYDGATLIASEGQLIAYGDLLSCGDFTLETATVNLTHTRQARRASTSATVTVTNGDNCVQNGFHIPRAHSAPTAECAYTPLGKEELFSRAVSLGLIDYVRKCRANGFVVSLSGGADSAAVVCLARIAWDRGLAAYGTGAWQQRLGLDATAPFNSWCTCVYQATAQSGSTTRHAAEFLANGIDAAFHSIDVENIVAAYQERVEHILGRNLSWEQDDIPLQNIQARVRAPSVWMLANCLNALLLSTSNRSEAAVGYATMDGDTCGGLSPIAGIDKAFLRAWLRWLQHHAPADSHAVPALSAVNEQQPTAELRPAAAEQTDEDDLMPYPVLDCIERLAIRDKLAPRDCYTYLRRDFPMYAHDKIVFWITRFFRLWCQNQWKRERYAPSFHLDDENLDPKTWCRFPILSGNFTHELQALAHMEEPV